MFDTNAFFDETSWIALPNLFGPGEGLSLQIGSNSSPASLRSEAVKNDEMVWKQLSTA